MSNVTDLMFEYFRLKDEDKAIRAIRNAFMETHECENEDKQELGDCIERLKTSMMGYSLCPICEKRNTWYMERQTLSHRRSVIIRKVKQLVRNLS